MEDQRPKLPPGFRYTNRPGKIEPPGKIEDTDFEDDLRKLAEAGVEVLGDSAVALEHHCRNGTWLFVGSLIPIVALWTLHISPGWLIPGTLFLGYILNEQERRQIVRRLRAAGKV
jgi:hypothetical protein